MATPKPPGAAAWVPADLTKPALDDAVQRCEGCELFAPATQAVMGAGPLTAPLMVVGEAPGDKEDQQGAPFVGPAGHLLVSALESAGIAPGEVYRTNAVKHFRFSGTRGKQRIHQTPSRVHVAACEPWLLAELDLVTPRYVVLLGATAGTAVYGSTFRVGAMRGTVQAWPEKVPVRRRPEAVVPTVHPSSVLRAEDRDAAFDAFVTDLRVMHDLMAA